MNREDIIKLARGAGAAPYINRHYPDRPVHTFTVEQLERFAALVAAAEHEKVAAWMIQRSYATGHGDTTEDLLKELDWQIDERIAAEREACAQIADVAEPYQAADLIRARGRE